MNQNNDDDIDKYSKYYKEVGPYLGLGLQLAATVVVLFFVGRWIDNTTGKEPLFTLIFAVLGIFTALYHFVKTVLNMGDKKKK
ncbi:MAG: AtpZ/AtpI family protein [Syntrophothermus sp.]